MHDERDRRRIEQDRAGRQVIEQAAAQLRHGAILAGYAGVPAKHFAFALALVLDELARHVRELRPEVRVQVVHGAGRLLGEYRTGPSRSDTSTPTRQDRISPKGPE